MLQNILQRQLVLFDGLISPTVFKLGSKSEAENLPVRGSIDSIPIQRFNKFLFILVLKFLNKTKIFILGNKNWLSLLIFTRPIGS